MAIYSFFSFFFLIICYFRICEAQLVPAAYMFGDSLIDVGNNNHIATIIKANFPYNGRDFPGGKPTGRFSNGKNTADFIAEKLGIPTPPPYLSDKNNQFPKGVSFASGGAGIFRTTNGELISFALDVSQQVQLFSVVQQRLVKQLGGDAGMKKLSKSIFVVVIGSNDIINYFKSDSKISKTKAPQQYVDEMISTLQGQLKQLHGLGARKFVITSIGSVGCMPLLRFQSANNSNECFQQANFWADKYNQQLQTMLKGLKDELKDINYSFIDTYALLLDIVQNPTIHGFTEVKSACCGLGRLKATVPCTPVALVCPNRNKYVFWDRYHPTEATDSLIINTTFDGNNKYIFPLNVKQLIAL